MILSFLVPSTMQRVGGPLAMLDFANSMVRRGHDVHVTHLEFLEPCPRSLEELAWCELDPRLRHHFPGRFDENELPAADFVFCFNANIPSGKGLPLMWFLGYGVLGPPEERLLAAPCPKLCISNWLVELARTKGAPGYEAVYLPHGLDHAKYRVVRPMRERPRRIAMVYNSHPIKGARFGLDAIASVLERVEDVDAVVFGTTPLATALPDGVTYYDRPPQRFIVEEIYNGSSVFVNSGLREGLGFAPLEAMACGCALVTTANGGSADYAMHEDTALVTPVKDAEAIAANVEALLLDDDRRVAMAERGRQYVERFNWPRSAELLEDFLSRYSAACA